MSTVTVSDKGQVVIPAEICRRLGISPGCQLEFSVEGDTMRMAVKRHFPMTRPEDGYGLLVCQQPGERRLSDFDVARAMRAAADDSD
jgi:AbrB family looped-hinge helix DNA binding protein